MLLVFEPSLLYIVAFLGCCRAGLVAVPVFPPDPRKLKKDMYMFAVIAANSGAKVALTSSVRPPCPWTVSHVAHAPHLVAWRYQFPLHSRLGVRCPSR